MEGLSAGSGEPKSEAYAKRALSAASQRQARRGRSMFFSLISLLVEKLIPALAASGDLPMSSANTGKKCGL